MMQFIDAAFMQPAPRAKDADAAGGFAVLPQQTESELQFSEVHSKLDRVLNFLQRDVGYCFVADAKSSRGGAVKLGDPERAVPAPWRNSGKSARFPKVQPSEGPPSQEPRGSGGSVQSDVSRTSSAGAKGDQRLIDLECGDYWIGPEAAHYAQYPDDLVLVSRFARLLVQATPEVAKKVNHQEFYKRILQGVRLMHLCEFNYSDVVVTLAYASIYFSSTFKSIGHMMSEGEAANVCTLLIFLAHSFILDETCPLRCWQKHIFRKYCTLKVLDAALFRLFNLRGFQLRLSHEEEGQALSALLHSQNGIGWEGTPKLEHAAASALQGREIAGFQPGLELTGSDKGPSVGRGGSNGSRHQNNGHLSSASAAAAAKPLELGVPRCRSGDISAGPGSARPSPGSDLSLGKRSNGGPTRSSPGSGLSLWERPNGHPSRQSSAGDLPSQCSLSPGSDIPCIRSNPPGKAGA
mmetsp:Transcript_140017/g.447812  ORF Transcript_140017/g.447812 Transcript_140017/m.447812 type:complete len:464 (-) Transcript_140017:166-1557(-)